MREEFPSLARITRPAISREPLAWAFVSGIGAGPIVGGIVRVVLLWAGPIVLPPTQPHPEWLTTNGLATLAGAIASGAVLTRAGGIAAIAVYIAYELLRLVAALPGRLLFCERSGNHPAPPVVTGCDYIALVGEHSLTWVGVAVGIAIAVTLLRDAPGENRLLRASGAFSLVLVATSLFIAVFFTPARIEQQNALLAVSTTTNLLAGVLAGVLLGSHRLAAAMLLAALIAAPSIAFALPFALHQPATAGEPVGAVLTRWAGVYIPLAAAAALLLARAFVRMGPREAGTDS